MSSFPPPSPQISDETLCSAAARGDLASEDLLVRRYSRLVRICARPLFLAGAFLSFGDGREVRSRVPSERRMEAGAAGMGAPDFWMGFAMVYASPRGISSSGR